MVVPMDIDNGGGDGDVSGGGRGGRGTSPLQRWLPSSEVEGRIGGETCRGRVAGREGNGGDGIVCVGVGGVGGKVG